MINANNLKKEELYEWLCRIGSQFNSAFLITDPNKPQQPILFVNDVFTNITCYSSLDIVGKNFSILFGEGVNQNKYNELFENVSKENYVKKVLVNYKKDGSPFWSNLYIQPFYDEYGQHLYNIVLFTDETVQVNNEILEENEKIKQLAYIDTLSGLTNYNYFLDKFSEEVNDNTTGFVLLFQPSEYVNIVDSFGKKQMSLLQYELDQRIRKTLSHIDIIVSRATEASLIITGFCDEEDIEKNVSLLLETTKEPIYINSIELFISVRIGAVSLKHYNGNTDDIVRLADIALSNSKKQAGNSIVFYKDEFGVELMKKMEIQNELIHALCNKDITIHLQPKVNIKNGKVESFEALARWNSEKLGYVPPDVFVEAAESIGKIQELDLLVLEQVLNWQQQRIKQNLKLYQVSVNISPSHFYLPNFIEELVQIVKKYEVDPKLIKIELTENVGLVDLELAKQLLNELQLHGFESSVDDFGIGFSSLSYLHQLPVSEIKIDRSFINQLHEEGGSVIVETIIQLAQSMKMVAVAEGIETEGQLKKIQEMCCPIAQGYYFYKPMPIEQIDLILKEEQ